MMAWSILMMILYGNGPAVTYNPFSRTKIDENGNIIQYKNRFFFVPDSYSDGVLVHMNKYTDDMNASRIESERRRLEQEIDELLEVENKKRGRRKKVEFIDTTESEEYNIDERNTLWKLVKD